MFEHKLNPTDRVLVLTLDPRQKACRIHKTNSNYYYGNLFAILNMTGELGH